MFTAVTAYFLIPMYTLFFVQKAPWLSGNLSVIGSDPKKQNAFVLLGLLLGFYFHTVLGRIIRFLQAYRPRWCHINHFFLHLALVCLFFTVLTPYLPDHVPVMADLHVFFAMTASVLLLFSLGQTIWELSNISPEWFQRMKSYRAGLLIIFFGCNCLFLFSRLIISTALEVFFILTATLFVQRLYEKILAFSSAKDTIKAEER